MREKPMVFNYQHYKDATAEVKRLRNELANMEIRHRIEMEDRLVVVRCKDCKYNIANLRRFYDNDYVAFYAWCEVFKAEHHGEGYCSFGKKVEESEDE